MGKSVVRVDETMLTKFLLIMPEGTAVTGANGSEAMYPYIQLSIEGDPVPDAVEVNAIINTREENGSLMRWMTFEERVSPQLDRNLDKLLGA
ncbi:hypothetical protein SM0020_12280 [Sinorhizobium meliloti CCNWSX0020]|uniref:Uncharacterized protein n=2 Tax=Rhizobium meliloti TaxID=382 RepID=H0FZ22_RHIML|nr:hypothetical protein SM0020_12280 [Sinorhizobium meliloti CCNWSX0020]